MSVFVLLGDSDTITVPPVAADFPVQHLPNQGRSYHRSRDPKPVADSGPDDPNDEQQNNPDS
jgi:hypothetical protein